MHKSLPLNLYYIIWVLFMWNYRYILICLAFLFLKNYFLYLDQFTVDRFEGYMTILWSVNKLFSQLLIESLSYTEGTAPPKKA